MKEKLDCQFCGKEFTKAGLPRHEEACKLNPLNQEELEEVEEIEEIEELEEVVEDLDKINEDLKDVAKKTITVKAKKSISCYIGAGYVHLVKGQNLEVDVDIKDILKRADLIEVM